MKKFRLAFVFVIALCFSLLIVSCEKNPSCESHKDGNKDGTCDVCGEKTEVKNDTGSVTLIEDGVPAFRFVIYDGASGVTRHKLDEVVSTLSDAGLEIDIVTEDEDDTDYDGIEVLVGPVESRGEEYALDIYTLGKKGYVIKELDGKIMLLSGDPATLADVIDEFFNDFLCYDEETGSCPENVNVSEGKWIEKIQSDYRISSVSVNKNDIRGYVIATQKSDTHLYSAAALLQDSLYEKTGIFLKIKYIENLSEDELENALIIRKTENAGADGFRVKTSGNTLLFETEFPIKAKEGVEKFLYSELTTKRGDVNFSSSFRFDYAVRYVYYNDFGAVGDGVTEDYPAIVKAHTYANIYGFTVCAGDSTGNTDYTYYIADIGTTAEIKTDVNWGKAKFYIDDKAIPFGSNAQKISIFKFVSDHQAFSISPSVIAEIVDENGGLSRDITKLNYEPGYPLLLIPYDKNVNQYMRYGHFTAGASQRELIVIDAEGNLIDNTGLLFDYTSVSSITAKRVDDKPITVKGGIFITDANSVEPDQQYYNSYTRNLVVERSNVTIRGLEHRIINEGEHGVPYSGFISMSWANNMLVEDTVLQGHKVYRDIKDNSWMGTYDIGGSYANGLYFKNCTQSNFFLEGSDTKTNSSLWGIMGTNYCKNITYDNCTLSRLDAHAGVYNASIINGSKVQDINLIGGGTALISDSYIYNTGSAITLRTDYGSLWKGDIIIKNVGLYINANYASNAVSLLSVNWNNHNFGYSPSYGEKIIIENLSILDVPNAKIYLFSDPTASAKDKVTDISSDRVAVPNTTNSTEEELKDKDGLYKNYCKVNLPTEIIIVNFSPVQKSNFSISTDEFLSSALKNKCQFMTENEYKDYLATKE